MRYSFCSELVHGGDSGGRNHEGVQTIFAFSSFLSFQASDADLGAFGEITYELVGEGAAL